jgi:hypothetical protein
MYVAAGISYPSKGFSNCTCAEPGLAAGQQLLCRWLTLTRRSSLSSFLMAVRKSWQAPTKLLQTRTDNIQSEHPMSADAQQGKKSRQECPGMQICNACPGRASKMQPTLPDTAQLAFPPATVNSWPGG